MVNSVSHQLVVIIKKGEIIESQILMMKLIDYDLWSNCVLSYIGLLSIRIRQLTLEELTLRWR
ncbi:unnamed protein product [Musa textilis]